MAAIEQNEKGATLRRSPTWRSALLLVLTATLYQAVWYCRTASVLRSTGEKKATPLAWVFAPLLGPLVGIAVYRMAASISRYRKDRDVVETSISDPAVLGMLSSVGVLLAGYGLIEPIDPYSVVVGLGLFGALPCLALNHQLNRTAINEVESLTMQHGVAIGVCLIIGLPLSIIAVKKFDASLGEGLSISTVIEDASGQVRVKIADTGWSKVENNQDAIIQLTGPDANTWVVIYRNENSLDDILISRRHAIEAEHRNLTCEIKKNLLSEQMITEGWLRCAGRNIVNGAFVYRARLLNAKGTTIEMLTYTGQVSEAARVAMEKRLYRLIQDMSFTP